MTLAVLTVLLSGLALGGAVVASHRARAAADLAALSGAARLARGDGGPRACAVARAVAAAHRAQLTGCRVDGAELTAQVSVPGPGPVLGPAVAQARAGPGRL